MSTPIRNRFLWIARTEGLSFIVLLFIAMPLKYGLDWAYAVKYVGWAHGILFVAYFAALAQIWMTEKWSFGKVVLASAASLLPFGTFWFEKNRL
jgi:integral membrane protein